MLKKFLWVLPFVFFIGGYALVSRLVSVEDIAAPSLIGLPLPEAFKLMAGLQLQGQIIAEREDADLPEGVIVDQAPQAGKKIKRSQPMYMTVTKRRPLPLAPSFLTLDKSAIEVASSDAGLRVKYHDIESQYPRGRCCAQFPAAGNEVIEKVVDVYLSAGMTTLRLFPLLVNQPVPAVIDFLKMHGMQVQLFTENELVDSSDVADCLVTAQKPLAGTLIDLKKPLLVQLQVAA